MPARHLHIGNNPEGKLGVYTKFFDFANNRVPLSRFLTAILHYYNLNLSQLHCIGAAKISNFEINCRLLAIEPTVHLFRAFYHSSWAHGWVSFSKRSGPLQCCSEKLDSLKKWRESFFWIDAIIFPHDYDFFIQETMLKDERPEPSLYNVVDAETLNANRIPFRPLPEEALCILGLSRNYLWPSHRVPTFVDEENRGQCTSLRSH